MPSKQALKNFERRIKEFDGLIYKINSWMDEFNQKILRLKQNILDEKNLLQTLFEYILKESEIKECKK